MFRLKHGMQKRVKDFWAWFVQNEERVFDFEKDQESIFRELHGKLRQVDDDLCFEFSNVIDGKREFVISAGEIRSAFPAVIELKEQAPSLQLFYVTAFRTRQPEILNVVINEIKVDSADVFVSIEKAERRHDVLVLIKGVDGASQERRRVLEQAMFLMLDEALGEYDVATKLGVIELADLDLHEHLPKVPISKLASVVDQETTKN